MTSGPERTHLPPTRRCLAAALWAAFVVLVLRWGVLFAMEYVGHGDELERVLYRLAAIARTSAACAVGLGLVIGFGARVSSSAGRWALALVTAAAVAAFLSGWPFADGSRRVGWYSTTGKATHAAIAVSAFSIASHTGPACAAGRTTNGGSTCTNAAQASPFTSSPAAMKALPAMTSVVICSTE